MGTRVPHDGIGARQVHVARSVTKMASLHCGTRSVFTSAALRCLEFAFLLPPMKNVISAPRSERCEGAGTPQCCVCGRQGPRQLGSARWPGLGTARSGLREAAAAPPRGRKAAAPRRDAQGRLLCRQVPPRRASHPLCVSLSPLPASAPLRAVPGWNAAFP